MAIIVHRPSSRRLWPSLIERLAASIFLVALGRIAATEEARVHAAHAIVATLQEDVAAQVGVAQARRDARVQAVNVNVGGYDSGEAVVVAVVEYLVQFLYRPRCGLLRSQVVYDKEVDRAYLLEAFVVGDIAAGGVGGAQLVEQVWRDSEVHL